MVSQDHTLCPNNCGYDITDLISQMKGECRIVCPRCDSTIEVAFKDPSGAISKSPAEFANDLFSELTSIVNKLNKKFR